MNAFPPRYRAFRFTLLPALVLGCAALIEAAPPPPPPPAPKEEDSNFFKRVGNALFKKTRDFEKSQEPPQPMVPPTQAKAKTARKTPSPNAAGQPIPGVNPSRRGETQYLREERQTGSPDGTEKVPATEGKPKTEKGAEKAAANEFVGPPAPLSYATPVAGRTGFVYPPGAERTEANLLDVRGLAPGQKARDPRTGSMFLVP